MFLFCCEKSLPSVRSPSSGLRAQDLTTVTTHESKPSPIFKSVNPNPFLLGLNLYLLEKCYDLNDIL